jgi:asparaginyl-tRNA synthetase
LKRTRVARVLASEEIGSTFTVMGWVRTKRESKGGFSFIELNDGSCMSSLQVIAGENLPNYRDDVAKLQTGCSVRVKGSLVSSPAKGQRVELKAEEVEVLGWADPGSILCRNDTPSNFRPLLISGREPTRSARRRGQNALTAIHTFFQERGFVYVHTPIITGSDCEGAGEMFRVTAFNLDQIPQKEGRTDFAQDFFGTPANLTVSGQLEAEVYALALGDVYTFGPTFRAENSNTTRHLAEFWMVEPEMAFDLEGNVMATDFLKYLFTYVLNHCQEDMEFFKRFIDPTVIETLEKLVSQDFKRMTYTEAVEILTQAKETFEFPVSWGSDIQAEHERYLCEKVMEGPIVLTDYPRTIKPFYMKVNTDGKTVGAMDVLVPKIGEIIGGSQREDDYQTLLERMKETNIDPTGYWWYLELRRFGSAPHSGFGLGFERLVQFVTGMANIRDVIPFPRTPGNVAF